MRGIAVGPCLDDYGAFRRSAWRLIRVAVGTRGLAGEPLERLGEVVDVRKSALARYLPHRQAGVVEQVLGALYPQVQQELVWRPAESVAEDVREPGSREPGSRGHVGDGQRFREMQRHERGDPIQELRLILEICAPARVALQQPEHEACYKVVGLEPSEEVPALPDAYSLEHGVPELRGVQRDEFGRNGDPCHLIQSRLHEPFEPGDVDHAGPDDEAALPRRMVEHVEVHVGGYGVCRPLQRVQLARLYKAELSCPKTVPAPFDLCDHHSFLYVHQQIVEEAPRSRIPRSPYREARVANVWNYRSTHPRRPFSSPDLGPQASVFYNNLVRVSNDPSSHIA